MSGRATTTRLIATAAREHLKPLGLKRKGRSRLWYDDRGWSLIVVEFQASHRDGTYLNVGAMWLWRDQDYYSFDEGHRLYWRDDGRFTEEPGLGETGWTDFADFLREHQFAEDVAMVAGIAAQRVEQLREQFPDPCAAARYLAGRPPGRRETPWWHAYQTGAAAVLCGDADAARRSFGRVTVTGDDPDYAQDLARDAADLAGLDDDGLRARIEGTVRRTRERLGLPPDPG